jgi:hypothetical protein
VNEIETIFWVKNNAHIVWKSHAFPESTHIPKRCPMMKNIQCKMGFFNVISSIKIMQKIP